MVFGTMMTCICWTDKPLVVRRASTLPLLDIGSVVPATTFGIQILSTVHILNCVGTAAN